MKSLFAGSALALLSLGFGASAEASVVGVDAFVGEAVDGFETQNMWGFVDELSLFDGQANAVSTAGGSNMHITSSWGWHSSVTPYAGNAFAGTTYGAWDISFLNPINMFGAYFALNGNVADGSVNFYSTSNELIASLTLSVPTESQWVWQGWSSDQAIARIVLSSNNVNEGAFLMIDNATFRSADIAVPTPAPLLLLSIGFLAVASARKKHR